MKYTAILPVRSGSRRLRGKNVLPFGDTNLLIHKIRQLKRVPQLDEIVVTSDSDEMLEMAAKEGVGVHRRGIEYSDEKTKSWGEVVAYCAKTGCHGDHVMWAFCTCPFCTEGNYTEAIKTYEEVVLRTHLYDSVFSVTRFKHYLWDQSRPINYTPGLGHVPSQMLPDWRVLVNGFFLAPRLNMIRWQCNTGEKPYQLLISKREALDIDDTEDFIMAEALLNYQQNDVNQT